MERDVWNALRRRLDQRPDRRPAKCQFTDRRVVEVFLWAALHDRPVAWACRPASWSGPRRTLPSPATMSRRLRSLGVLVRLRRLLGRRVVRRLVVIDGKPLRVSRFSKDRQATAGYGAGQIDRGYKLHAACDGRGRLAAFAVRPMHEPECRTARKLVGRAAGPGSLTLGDASYDANELYRVASSRGGRLVAPRRKPGRGLGHRRHEADRLRSIALLEGEERKRRQASRLRTSVERYFGWLTGTLGGGLPPWARTLRRVSRWVMAKIVIEDAKRWP
jgi:hypothetical protein